MAAGTSLPLIEKVPDAPPWFEYFLRTVRTESIAPQGPSLVGQVALRHPLIAANGAWATSRSGGEAALARYDRGWST